MFWGRLSAVILLVCCLACSGIATPSNPTEEAPAEKMAAQPVAAPVVESSKQTARPQTRSVESGSYWVSTNSNTRHNSRCKYYQKSKGHSCGPSTGKACKICGG